MTEHMREGGNFEGKWKDFIASLVRRAILARTTSVRVYLEIEFMDESFRALVKPGTDLSSRRRAGLSSPTTSIRLAPAHCAQSMSYTLFLCYKEKRLRF